LKALIYGNYIFSYEMAWGFQQIGWETEVIGTQDPEQIKQIILASEADLFFTLGAPLELDLDVLNFISAQRPDNMKYIHWDTDGISSTYYPSIRGDGIEMDVIYTGNPQLVLTMCPKMQELVKKKGYDCEIMHYAYCPVTHYPMPEYYDEEHKYINLIGNAYVHFYDKKPDHYRYHSMKILLKPLLEKGYTVHVYGDSDYLTVVRQLFDIHLPVQNLHGRLPYNRTSAAYNSSFINIVTQNHARTITKRTFEILGCGGFALSADNIEIRNLFVPGRDLAVSSYPEQTIAMVEYYENHIDEWKAVRKNALESIKNHTYKQRAEYIVQLLYK
jgi:spore maturation protein CgeB